MYSGKQEDGTFQQIFQTDPFSESLIRKQFIRKVYAILTAQLLFTMAIVAFFFIPEVAQFAFANIWLFWFAMGLNFILLIALACVPNLRRKPPGNYICLAIFTLSEGFLLGCVVATYTAEEVLMALGICAIVVIMLTLFAFQTKIDFTTCGGILLVIFMILMIISITAIFFHNKIMSIFYACLGAFVFSGYILFDTQLMLGGKHKYAIEPEEYIFAALNLYIDIVNLFLYLLQLISSAKN